MGLKIPKVMIAAVKSGSGKTTITCAFLKQLLCRKKHPVSFKCGPDYIDPMFHEQVLKIPSKNLDTFFSDASQIQALYEMELPGHDIAVLEGVMGLYDGLGGIREEGSSYHLAKTLDVPVILVVDAHGMGKSVISLIAGFLQYDEKKLIKGVILNRTSKMFFDTIAPLIEEELAIKALGCIPNEKELTIGSRHLGLILPEEMEELNFQLEKAGQLLEKYVDVDAMIGIAECALREKEETVEDDETLATEDFTADADDIKEAINLAIEYDGTAPDPANYGIWVPGIPVLIGDGLDAIGCADWLNGLILDGIVAGVGAVLGFVPQMLVLFLLLAILEACGYMARIAFIMDRIFRRFGLSGKSFIPILIGTGCGVPGIMASRTIENERDRRMTIMTTTFIPCGAKTPFIAMIAGAIFGGSPWVATSAYFIGMAAIIVSGIILKKTKLFSGDPAPFVMELPAYHIPTVGNVLRSMWERGWSFIKKAGTIILLSTIVVWFTTYFGFADDGFRMLAEDEIDMSILAKIGNAIGWIFTPLGWGNWQAAVASITGLVAKENIVGTMGILYGGGDVSPYAALALAFTKLAGFSFLTFNLLCAPCFAAIGAIKREMNSAKWTWIAIGYQCGFAYVVSLCIYNIGSLIADGVFSIWTVVAFVLVAGFLYLLFRPTKEAEEYKKAAAN